MFCPQCGARHAPETRFCAQCGASLAGGGATTATSSAPGAVLRRDGDRLVVPQGATLPPFCVRCGQPTTRTISKTFAWHTPWLYLLIFFPGLLIYIIVALVVSKRQKLAVPVCDEHAKRRTLYLTLGTVFLLGFLPLGIVVGSLGSDTGGLGFFVGLATFIASLVFFVLGSRLMAPREITDSEGVYGSLSPVFLQQVEMAAGTSAAFAASNSGR